MTNINYDKYELKSAVDAILDHYQNGRKNETVKTLPKLLITSTSTAKIETDFHIDLLPDSQIIDSLISLA